MLMYSIGEKKATREAYGAALAEFGCDERVVVLDADLSPATKTSTFKKEHPERFFNCGIAEGNMMTWQQAWQAAAKFHSQAHLQCLRLAELSNKSATLSDILSLT
jgi:deoxyxylulose-5-phosphate synthase